MTQVYLSIGSNINRQHYVASCLDGLAHRFGALEISSVFESEAVGFDGDPFYNLVVGLHTDLTLDVLFHFLRETEHAHDRCRQAAKFSPRTLDIDILTYGDYCGPFAGGELPREEITRNAFVLWPLAEIAPTTLHPGLGLSYAQLWAEFDRTAQALWPVSFHWQGRELRR
ncbi:MAG TPA: 2-amino-4-hydroxy-6-hydroxymethyldihydropteridine diphosphokinase [Motiliproteus sp.]